MKNKAVTRSKNATEFSKCLKQMKSNVALYVFLLPALAYIFIFCYWPLYGVQIAFRDYNFVDGIMGSRWVGLKWFEQFFRSPRSFQIIGNTLAVSLYSIAAGFPVPIIFALLLNQVGKQRYKRVIQTVTYMPHFISIVVVVGMISCFFSQNSGFINTIIEALGGERTYFMGLPQHFRSLYVWSGVWQEFGWGSIISYNHLADSVTWVNETWLDDLGLSKPETTEDFYEMLTAFKESNVIGADGFPLDFCTAQWAGDIKYLSQSWGIQGYYNLKDGKVTPSVNTDNYREFLEYCHKLVQEGLVNSEGFSQTTEQYYANIANMKDAVFLGWSPATFMSDNNNIAQYKPLSVLKVDGKEDLRTVYNGSKVKSNRVRNAFVMSAACEEPEAALRWWDYLSSSQDMAMYVAWGEEGIGYEKRDDGLYYTLDIPEETLKEYELTSMTAYKASIGIINYHPLVLNNLTMDVEKYPLLSDTLRQTGIDAIYDNLPDEWIPTYVVSKDAQDELDFIQTDLLSFIDSFTANSIMEGVTDESWNTFLSDLETYSYSQYISWYQDLVDGKNK